MSIFARIIKGEIPCFKVYEDAAVIAFLDINPISVGHTLVVPKEPAETLDLLSETAAGALGRALPLLCRVVKEATGCPAFNLLQNNGDLAGQVVRHVHFHIIPRYSRDGLDAGLEVMWPAKKLNPAEGAALANKMMDLARAG